MSLLRFSVSRIIWLWVFWTSAVVLLLATSLVPLVHATGVSPALFVFTPLGTATGWRVWRSQPLKSWSCSSHRSLFSLWCGRGDIAVAPPNERCSRQALFGCGYAAMVVMCLQLN